MQYFIQIFVLSIGIIKSRIVDVNKYDICLDCGTHLWLIESRSIFVYRLSRVIL